MATTYKSTIEINVWKEHACIGCGSRFRYLFKRKKTGQGGSPEAASAAARLAVMNALENEVDMHPCPGCGLYQPDMVGSRRTTRHWWTLAAAWAALLLVLILRLTDVVPANTAALAAAAACAVLGLVHLLLDANNPNRHPERNQQAAQQRVERGDLWLPPGSKADPEAEMPVFGWSTAHTVAYVLFGLGLLAFLSPEILRALHGWPANPQWYPHVAGPGDQPYLYFPDQITSVKGYWRGLGKAQVVNAAEVGLPVADLRIESKQDNWGQSISIGSKESKTSTNTLWLRVLLPNDPLLEGKTLKLNLHLIVVYPALSGINFDEVHQDFSHKAEIRLSGAGAGVRYQSWWWGGFVGGVLLVTVSSLLLVRLSSGLRKLAQPTSIFAPGADEEEVPQAEGAAEVLPADPPRREDDDGIVRRD
jgi:hypothetical protein